MSFRDATKLGRNNTTTTTNNNNKDLEVAYPQSGSSSTRLLIELEFGNVGFWGEGKTGVPGEKPLGAKERTNNKLNPHMASMPGFEPGPHWWKASALTSAPALVPQEMVKGGSFVLQRFKLFIFLPRWRALGWNYFGIDKYRQIMICELVQVILKHLFPFQFNRVVLLWRNLERIKRTPNTQSQRNKGFSITKPRDSFSQPHFILHPSIRNSLGVFCVDLPAAIYLRLYLMREIFNGHNTNKTVALLNVVMW